MIRRPTRALGILLLGVIGQIAPCTATAATPAVRVYDAMAIQAAPALAEEGAARSSPKPAPAIPTAPAAYLTENLGWLTLVYHPSTRDRVRPLFTRAAEFRAELSDLLGRQALTSHVEVHIAATPAELTALSGMELGGATAAAFGDLHFAVVSAASRLALDSPDIESTLRHELAHLALDEAAGGAAIPRWLHEGFAIHAADEHAALRAQTLSLASLRARLVPLTDIEHFLPAEGPQASIAYAQAADFVRFLLVPDRRAHFVEFLDHARDGASPLDALPQAYGAPLAEIELAWREDVARRHGFVPVLVGALLVLVVLVAGAFALRRLRERRTRLVPLRRTPRVAPEGRARSPRSVSSAVLSARRARSRADGGGDPDVPKVEHDGRWYTLH